MDEQTFYVMLSSDTQYGTAVTTFEGHNVVIINVHSVLFCAGFIKRLQTDSCSQFGARSKHCWVFSFSQFVKYVSFLGQPILPMHTSTLCLS